MARKTTTIDYSQIPNNLDRHPFFGLKLDENQLLYRDAIWDKDKLAVLCDAGAGSGKTTVAVATAVLMCKYGLYDQIIYLVFPSQEGRLGYLPGTLDEKVNPYMSPLYQALITIGENPNTVINNETMVNQKNGTGYITTMSDTFTRGQNFNKTVLICDECQNATRDQLRTVITRCSDDCKVILIGSHLQIDLKDKAHSGFMDCIKHFKSRSWSAVCKLTKNYRGVLSSWADRL